MNRGIGGFFAGRDGMGRPAVGSGKRLGFGRVEGLPWQ